MTPPVPMLQTWAEIRADVAEYWYIYLAMPFIASLIGYVTKVIAVEMLYRPLEFKGIGPIGWQGIVPRRSGKVAAVTIELLTENLLKPEDLFAKFDAKQAVEELREPLTLAIDEMAREFTDQIRPGLWDSMPGPARRALQDRLRAQAPFMIESLLTEIKADLPQYLDLQFMTVTTMVRNKAKLNRLMRTTAGSAMSFMRRSGIYFGFLIGIVQAAAWGWIHALWLMPFFGFLTGWLSDWLALNLLFIPREPKRILGLRLHGVIQKNRDQITRDYAKVMAQDLFSPEVIFESLLNGPSSERLFAMMDREISKVVDKQTGRAAPLVQLAVGSARYREAKAAVVRTALDRIPETVGHAHGYAGEAMDIENTIADKMSQLNSEQFEAIMRPIFKDDEWLIILVGAVLGAVVGELQVHALIVPFTDVH
jgi:uncharacterized membrane protein YheB (UPF0754 family)